jgi:hypothetical protein
MSGKMPPNIPSRNKTRASGKETQLAITNKEEAIALTVAAPPRWVEKLAINTWSSIHKNCRITEYLLVY